MKPLVYKGQKIPGYSVDKDGNIWSHKRDMLKKLVANIAGKNNPYPKVSVFDCGRLITVPIHRAVAESVIKRPRPNEFRAEIWKTLNDAERSLVYQAYEVNHIDHDTTNFHPSNLEWVSRRKNIEKRNNHYSYMN